MKTIIITTFLVFATLFSSCNFDIDLGEKGNGKVVKQERTVSQEFDQIKGSEGLDVYITQGSENKIVVEADENLLDLIETEVTNGKLIISTSENIRSAEAKIVHVTVKELTSLQASSGAEVTGISGIKSEDLSIKSSSGAEIDIDVFSNKLDISASSGATVNIKGKASDLTVRTSSGSEVDAKDLLLLTCDAKASSGAEITVNVKEKLEVKVSSGGEINYYGNPVSVNKNDSRSGNVRKM